MVSIVERADGVFLWVKLVVRSLLEGLSNRDEVPDLQRRLQAIPLDLEDLFKSMLDKIDSFYLEKAAKIFQIIRASHRITDGWEVDPDQLLRLDTLSLSFAISSEPNQVFTAKPQAMSEEDRQEKRQDMKDQLKVCCAGLIETGMTSTTLDRVLYLHRTVRDYLDRPDNLKMLVTRTATSDFEPSTEMLRSLIIQLQRLDSLDSLEKGVFNLFSSTALMYARQAETDAKRANSELLNQFNETVTNIVRKNPDLDWHGYGTWATSLFLERVEDTFLAVAIKWDLVSFMENHFMKTRYRSTKKKGRPLLEYALGYEEKRGPEMKDKYRYSPRPRMVALLLEHGCDCNESYQGGEPLSKTAIFNAITQARRNDFEVITEKERELLSLWLEVVKLMLKHGATASVFLTDRNGQRETARKVLTEALFENWPEKAAEIDEIFRKHGGKLKLSMTQKMGFRK